jgi:hypothetical protein
MFKKRSRLNCGLLKIHHRRLEAVRGRKESTNVYEIEEQTKDQQDIRAYVVCIAICNI